MTNFLPRPCARWANSLAAHPDDLSLEERRALDAHVASCWKCSAVRADYLRMNARIRSLPDPRMRPDLPPWLLALQAATKRDGAASNHVIPVHSMEKYMQTRRKEPGMEMPAPTPIQQGHQARRRVVSWVTAVAALVVIAVITTALLVSHTGKPGTTGNPQSTATSTSTPSFGQGWKTIPGLTGLSDQPFLAPGNPKVIYLLGTGLTSFKRSDDGGAHWTNLSLPPHSLPPQASQAENPILMVSASNAQNIFLLLSFAQSPSTCSGSQPPSGQINGYSGYSCQFPYYSTDGGVHWGLMRWSASGKAVPIGNIIAQGNHLYSLIFDQNQNRRLITSSDGGATWRFADAALLTQGQGVCAFTAVPSGSSVYAMAQAGGCAQAVGYLRSAAAHPQASSGLAIWRTDDAGADWAQVSAFPYQQADTQNFWAIASGGAEPTLFAAAGQGTTYQRLVSTDGGKTWQPLPTAGIPADANLFSFFQTGLSDGSLLAAVQMTAPGSTPIPAWSSGSAGGDISIYAWKPGSQAWRQITSPFAGSPNDPLVVTSAGGHDTLWLVVTDSNGGYSVLYDTLK
jgi:hypothetical protein